MTAYYRTLHPEVRTADPMEAEQVVKWKKARAELEITDALGCGNSAAALRSIMKTDYLDVEDLNELTMERFFAAHRVFAGDSADGIGGLSIRFTVQYNLFAGTVNALGNDKQRTQLREIFKAGELGSFLLTEKAAGVLSGLIVKTTATFVDGPEPGFLIHSPDEDAKKVWISQGLECEHGVVIANLILKGKDLGPHGFLINMKDQADEESGRIVKVDMGEKTAFNSLDNADISFNQFFTPLDTLLAKHSVVTPAGEYLDPSTGKEKVDKLSFVTIAQRLLSGRIAIAETSISYMGYTLSATKDYAETRKVWVAGDKQQTLSTLPYIKEVFDRKSALVRVHMAYLRGLERRFADSVNGPGKKDGVSRDLQMHISIAKASAVDFATQGLLDIRTKVGSYSLMAESPFGRTNDIVYCMRFAEGDTHILQQSIVRDAIRPYLKSTTAFMLLFGRVVLGAVLCTFRIGGNQGKLDYFVNQSILSLLLFLRSKTSALGKLGAWYAAGSRVYNCAKAFSSQKIYNALTRDTSVSAADREVFLEAAVKEVASL